MTFRNLYNTEASTIPSGSGFDGMVLEISNPTVNGGAFLDILAAGASFVIGGYNRTINASPGQPDCRANRPGAVFPPARPPRQPTS